MTIKAIWKVEGDSNEYETEQQAQIAEVISDISGIFLNRDERYRVAKAVEESFCISGRKIKQPEGEKKIAPFAGEQK